MKDERAAASATSMGMMMMMKALSCQLCDKVFDDDKTLKDHQKDAHFKCHVCDKQSFHVHRINVQDNDTTLLAARVPFGKPVNQSIETKGFLPKTSKANHGEEAYPEGAYKLTKREKKALEAAPGFRSNYPWFAVPIVKSHKHQLILPFKFVKEHLPKESMNAEIVDSNGRTWKILYKYKKGRSLLYTGWNSFWLGNELKEGDVCAFELIDNQTIKLRVSIRKKSN